MARKRLAPATACRDADPRRVVGLAAVSRRTGGASLGCLGLTVLFAACGARTGLPVDLATDAVDATSDASGRSLDASTECSTPSYCDPADLSQVYRCGAPIVECSSLEQCEERAGGPQCINPCLDALGNDTSNGCEFYAVEMDTTPQAEGVCYAVFVVNEWKTGERAKIEVSRDGRVLPVAQFARIPAGHGTGITYAPYDPGTGLAAGQVAILFLSRDPGAKNDPNVSFPRVLSDCPAGVTPAIVGDAALHGTGKGSAFHIRTNVPVVAYQMLPYGGGSARVTGSTLLLPTSAWGQNYVVADASHAPTSFVEDRAGPTTVVIAGQDDTTVTVRATTAILAGGGLPQTAAGTPVTFTLGRGQYLQFTQPLELTGAAVESDKPVAVIGGSTLMDLPLDRTRADSAEQMLPPLRALGSEYVAVRYRNRVAGVEEAVPWRIVGAVAGTRLTYEPARPSGAPTTLDAQQVTEFVDTGPFVVRSQDAEHPFYVASYMTGGAPYNGRGDPEFVNVVPPAQYLSGYTFFTDPTYPETNLVLIRVRDGQTGQMPEVTLDCAGVISGWQAVGTGGNYELARVDLSTGDFKGVGACDNGVHAIRATLAAPGTSGPSVPRLGVTIWGWGNELTWLGDNGIADEINPKFTRWVSYGYPAGADFRQLNRAVLPAR
ncbi:MAG: IgGFc-binding protein [Myxococcota bacterium]|nr:IgGFc-binding protein [Myxococcota bacterium]